MTDDSSRERDCVNAALLTQGETRWGAVAVFLCPDRFSTRLLPHFWPVSAQSNRLWIAPAIHWAAGGIGWGRWRFAMYGRRPWEQDLAIAMSSDSCARTRGCRRHWRSIGRR